MQGPRSSTPCLPSFAVVEKASTAKRRNDEFPLCLGLNIISASHVFHCEFPTQENRLGDTQMSRGGGAWVLGIVLHFHFSLVHSWCLTPHFTLHYSFSTMMVYHGWMGS